MALKNQDIVNNQKKLAEQVKMYAQQQAASAYNQGQRSLQEQLRQQRMNMQQSRSQLSEQAFLANRSIQQGAQARGLGSSGLKDLSVVQSQLAQGKAVSNLEAENAGVQRAAMSARLGLEESLKNARTGAEVQYAQDNLNADRTAMEMQQRDRDLMLQLMDMAGAGASADTIKAYADILGLDLNSQIGENGTLQEQLNAIAPSVDLEGSADFSAITGNNEGLDNFANIIRWLDPSKYIVAGAENLFKTEDASRLQDTAGFFEGAWSQIDDGKFGYKIGNEDFFGTPEEAKQKIDSMYEGRQYFGKEINTRVTANGAIRFRFDGKDYNTYAQAVKAIQARLDTK